MQGLDSGERNLVDATQDSGDPLRVALDEFGGFGQRLGFGEEQLDVVDAVVLSVHQAGLVQGAELLGVVQNCLLLSVAQSVSDLGLSAVFVLEDVSGHGGSFLGMRDGVFGVAGIGVLCRIVGGPVVFRGLAE